MEILKKKISEEKDKNRIDFFKLFNNYPKEYNEVIHQRININKPMKGQKDTLHSGTYTDGEDKWEDEEDEEDIKKDNKYWKIDPKELEKYQKAKNKYVSELQQSKAAIKRLEAQNVRDDFLAKMQQERAQIANRKNQNFNQPSQLLDNLYVPYPVYEPLADTGGRFKRNHPKINNELYKLPEHYEPLFQENT